MNYPKELFRNVYWTFLEPTFTDQNSFRDRLKEYHKGIGYKGKLPPIKWEEVCLEAKEVVMQYAIFPEAEYDEIKEPQKKLTADNGKSFKAKELLFKMHNAICEEVANQDHHFFEGLTFATDQDPDFDKGTPVYFVDLGS
jgi:hypothetical protein